LNIGAGQEQAGSQRTEEKRNSHDHGAAPIASSTIEPVNPDGLELQTGAPRASRARPSR
jgi:hypothetical protein